MLIRIMRDGRPSYGSAGAADRNGIPVFRVGGGDTVLVELDYTAFLGAETYSSGNWTISEGTLGTTTQSGGLVTALVNIPGVLAVNAEEIGPVVTVVHRLTTSGGRIANNAVRLWAQPASGTDLFILDGSILA